MKRAVALFLSLVLLAVLCSCGKRANPDDFENEVSNELTAAVTQEPESEEVLSTEAENTRPEKTETESSKQQADSKSYEERAAEILGTMTLNEKIAQMIIVSCHKDGAAASAAGNGVGGLVLYEDAFQGKTRDDVVSMTDSFQRLSDIPLLIAVDEEGGSVNRVSTNKKLRAVPFWSPQDLYTEGGFDLIRSDTKDKCSLLKSLGVNVNMAPVCDVSIDTNDYIFKRTFGKDAVETSEYVAAVVKTMGENGVGSVLKHFPGYGNNRDTHTGIAQDNRPYETFEDSDFLPFRAGIEAGAGAVLVSHNIVTCMDKTQPASLSPEVHRVLRETLGFNGVIITDDLYMDAITAYTNGSNSAVQAVLADNDLICCADFEESTAAVLDAVNDGTVSEEQIDEHVSRILYWKIQIGIIK